MEVYLYNSTVCRLCGQENDKGNFLYSKEDNLSETINTYLPLKVTDDGILPRTICPGCTIQLEATVAFIDLIINGQKILRKLYQTEKEYKKTLANFKEHEIVTEKIIYEIRTSDGVYEIEHPITLQVAGLEKPKKKRGRPPKKHDTSGELINREPSINERAETNKNESNDSDEPTGKRRRKIPTRFNEVVQGEELERIFKEEGVTDGEESDNGNKENVSHKPLKVSHSKEPKVIGHVEASGELVVFTKGKGRKGRPKGRRHQKCEQCMICGMQFKSIRRYMSHIAQHGPVLYQCTQCCETFSTRLLFCEHQTKTKHVGQNILQCKDVTPDDLSSSKSPIRSENEKDNEDEKPHKLNNLAAEEHSYNSVHLTEELSKDSNLNNTKDDIEGNEKGDEKDSTEKNKNSDKSKDSDDSLSQTEDKEGEEKTLIKCNQCEKVFRSRQSKSLHIKATHQGQKPYKCVDCGAAFGYPRSLVLHRISHRRRASKGYACDLCGKVLNHPSSVVYHKQSMHGVQRYVCGTCGKCFRHQQLLQRHQIVHTQLRPFQCEFCDAWFKTNANLVNHKRLHTGIKKFSCEICKQRFSHRTSLTMHLRWHNGLKPYSCKTCGKSFTQKGNLLEHERIHTGEKPFQCNRCPSRFTTSSQYRLHTKRHALPCGHCRLTSRGEWSSALRREAGGRVRCTVCTRVFVDRTLQARPARRHIQQQERFATKSVNQKSLLVPDNQLTLMKEVEDTEEVQTPNEIEEVIYITYNDEGSPPALHMIEPEETIEEFGDTKTLSTHELYSGPSMLMPVEELEQFQLQELVQSPQNEEPVFEFEENVQQRLHMIDEQGNPIHFARQDGTQFTVTAVGGKCLQVVTEDGQTIPIEINRYTNQQKDDLDIAVQQLNLHKSADCTGSPALTQFYTLV